MGAKRYDMTIKQGETFQRVIRWETLPFVWKSITAISKTGPARITAVDHVIPDGWRAVVKDAGGMDEINTPNWPPRLSDFHKVAVESNSVVNFNDVSSVSYDPYTSGGYLVYYTPVPLTGYTARMKIKDRVGGTVLATFVSPTDIAIDVALCTLTLTIAASATELYTWVRGVYDFEVVSLLGVVTPLIAGSVTITKEVTTTT
jgi:hypothetical protein